MSGGCRPGVLLNILQCTAQTPSREPRGLDIPVVPRLHSPPQGTPVCSGRALSTENGAGHASSPEC